jgi:hypothetical protein
MSTTTIKNYPIAPYYDDFDETKNYHRILYRPGYAVQARELTQMQTALQAQLDRFGQYAFKHGSRVVGGKVTINTQYDFIKIDSSFTHSVGGTVNTDGYLSSFVGLTITGGANAGTPITAKVIAVLASDGLDPNTLYIKYTGSSGTNRTTTTFASGEEFSAVDGSTTYYGKVQTPGTPVGLGSSVNIEEGVYFLSGTFTYVPAETLILDKYSNTPSYTIGLNVIESIVDTDADVTLKDNAQGTPNEAAPGATRYKVDTTLVKESLTNLNSANSNYVTLLRIEGGKLQVDKTDSQNVTTELSKRLARRTFEESGNYSVRPYQLDIKEHLDDAAGNNGYLTAAGGGVSSKLAIGVEPGVSYVQGFRNENIATKYIAIDKPRDAADSVNIDTNANVPTPVGNYIKITNVKGAPDIANFSHVLLKSAVSGGGSTLGTARARALELISGQWRLHLFDINMTSGTFSAIESVSQTDTSSGIVFKGDILDSTALRYDVGSNGLIFKMPYAAVKTLDNPNPSSGQPANTTEYTVKQVFTAGVTNNVVTITRNGGSEGHFTNINTATFIAAGSGSLTTPSFVGSTPSDGATQLQFAVTAANGTQCRIIADVEKDGGHIVEKQKTRNNNTVASSVSASADGSYSLGKADIIKLVSVVDATGTNVTERFTLDNGQRDNYYDIGRILRKPDSSPAAGALTITFDYYTHAGGDYFSADSYPVGDYDTIGTFNSSQGAIKLRDAIDFRPRKGDAADGGSDDFTITGAGLTNPPDPQHAMSMYVQYYMPRVDKLYITKEGTLKIAKGVPSDTPKAPAAPEDSMALYDLRLSPYVFTLEDVKPKLIDNKRYTMRDIGAIDKRVKTLEYYTSLSLLEQQASNTQLFEENAGVVSERFKNGFVVDGFRGHNVGQPSDPDYQVSVDKTQGVLRPMFDERNVNLVRADGDTGTVVRHSSLMMLPHSINNYIDQPYSSVAVNVNPYNVFTWSGAVTLSPESDEWKETDVRPDIIINDEGIYDQFVAMAEESGVLGTVWNEWETNWTGTSVETSTTGGVGGGFNWWGEDFGVNGGGFFGGGGQITTTTATTTTQHQSQSGVTTSIASDTVTKEGSNKVVEVNFVPFMRSRKIYFKGELLKPNTRVYPFFNDTDVSTFCKAESFVEFTSRTNVTTYEGQYTHPNGSSTLTTDSTGKIEGSFVIPRNDILKFKTGTRTFKLTDSAANNSNDGSENTFAETQFHAEGLIESVQKEIISTKVPSFVTNEINNDRTITDTTVQTSVEWIDPLAQTFLVDTEGGIFCKNIELFFKTKDLTIPVRVSIRSVENGTPTQKIVPGADKVVYYGNINTSDDASLATTIHFDHPIYLAQNQEYAIVIMAQSDQYQAWVAEMGGFDKTNPNNRITKQPYGGVFFTSQNASTWTPEQSRDLKFKLNKCVFSLTASDINLVNDNIPARLLKLNPMSSTSGSGVVKVFHKNHGMHQDSGHQYVVAISGSAAFNGIAAGNLDGTHNISNVTHDTYEFTAGAGDTASATGSGGGDAIYASENRQMDVVRANIQALTVPGTSIRYYMTPYSPTEVVQGTGEILANENITFSSPKTIASSANSTTKTFNLRCTLQTEKDTISPVIDMNRTSLFTIQNRVIDNSTGDELSATGGNQLARYLTKKIELAEEADKLDVYLNINRPRSGNVDLYWRVVEGGSSADISTVAWSATTITQEPASIPINDNPSVFKEIHYHIDPAGSFGTMQFKIVLRSSNSSTVPLVKDFRAIAST